MRIVVPIRLMLWGLWLVAGALAAKAQQDMLFSQYTRVRSYYIPAAVGMRPDIDLTAIYHQQWLGVEGAPGQGALLAHTQFRFLERAHGVGISVGAQKKGLFTNSELGAQYAFLQPLWGGVLSVGLQGALFTSSFDGTQVYLPEGNDSNANDPAIPLERVAGQTFDAASGVAWYNSKLFVGFSARHLLAPRLYLKELYYLQLVRSYTLIAQVRLQRTDSPLVWIPSLLGAIDEHKMYRVDANLQVEYAQRFTAGVLFRPLQAAGFNMGMQWQQFSFGYAFEMPITALARGQWGTHEVTFSYRIPKKPEHNSTARYKSVRLL